MVTSLFKQGMWLALCPSRCRTLVGCPLEALHPEWLVNLRGSHLIGRQLLRVNGLIGWLIFSESCRLELICPVIRLVCGSVCLSVCVCWRRALTADLENEEWLRESEEDEALERTLNGKKNVWWFLSVDLSVLGTLSVRWPGEGEIREAGWERWGTGKNWTGKEHVWWFLSVDLSVLGTLSVCWPDGGGIRERVWQRRGIRNDWRKNG